MDKYSVTVKRDLESLRGMDVASLLDELAEAKQQALRLRFGLATGQQDNTSELGRVRRRIARINTVLRQREIAAAEGTVGR